MKITFVLPTVSLSGGIRVVAIYAERLKKRGHKVTVISTPEKPPGLRQQAKSLLRGQGWISVAGKQPSHLDGVGVEHRVIERWRPVTDADVPDADAVVATWWETAEWVWRLKPSKGVKVHFMQDYEVWGGPAERVDATCRLPIAKIVIAGWVRELLEKRFHQSPLALIPNSVETEKFYAPPRTKQSLPTVGMTYTTFYNKGCDTSIQAYRIAREAIPNLRLIAFGSGPVSAALPLPAEASYTLRAPDDKLKEIYSQCDAWLFETRIEGFGLPILEAMACRTPVIGTPAGAAPELLSGGAGILVKPEDSEDMAAAIERICRLSDGEWRAMSDAAYAKATSYSWDEATDRFEAALQMAIEGRQQGDFHSSQAPDDVS
jgi:glycosyltransferase involved in cell wall biosynthesis